MRSIDEIRADVKKATNQEDNQALILLSDELRALGTLDALALEAKTRGRVYLNSNSYGEALEWMEKAVILLRDLGDLSRLAGVYNDIGGIHAETGEYNAALEAFDNSRAMYEDLGDAHGVARIIGNIGTVQKRTGYYTEALKSYEEARSLFESFGDLHHVAIASGNIGLVHVSTGSYPLALEWLERALALYERLELRHGMAIVTGNIGLVFLNTSFYPEALEWFEKSLSMYEDLGDRIGIAIVSGNIGNVHAAMNSYTKALEWISRALALHEELGDRSGVARVTSNIGGLHRLIGNYPEALEWMERGLAMSKALGDRGGLALTTGRLGLTFVDAERWDDARNMIELLESMEILDPGVRTIKHHLRAKILQHDGDLLKAQDSLEAALDESRIHGLRAEEANAHESLRDLAQKRNDLSDYIEHNNEYSRIKELISGAETKTRLAMQAKEKELYAERKEREREKALLYGTLPKAIADRIIRGEDVTGDHHENVSVMFLDIVGFTAISDRIPPGHVVHLLEVIFTTLDAVSKKHDVTKVKTIGDSYMAVSFSTSEPGSDHIVKAALCAVEMLAALHALQISMPPEKGDTSWIRDVGDIEVRVGLHSGPVTAGVIGTERMQYDVWGDTVNVASRMESHGEPGRIHVSETFAAALAPYIPDSIKLKERGVVEVKGKGSMKTYWLESS